MQQNSSKNEHNHTIQDVSQGSDVPATKIIRLLNLPRNKHDTTTATPANTMTS